MSYQGKNKLITSAMCPYWRSEYVRCITCEGIMDGSTMMSKFNTEDDKQDYADRYCRKYPNECIIAVALDRKWG